MSLPLLRLGSLPTPLASTSRLLLTRPLSISPPSLVYTSTAIAPVQPDPSTFVYSDHLKALQARTARLPRKQILKQEALDAAAVAAGEVVEKKPEVKKMSKDKISLSNLPHGLTQIALKQILEAKGLSVGAVRIMVFPRSDGRFVSRGYGWATLKDPAHHSKGMKAALALDGLIIDEFPLRVEVGHAKTHNLFFSPSRIAARLAWRESNRPPLAVPVPGQWAFKRNQALLAAGLPLPLIGAPGEKYNLRVELPSGKPRKETGVAGMRHMRRFVPGESRPEDGEEGYGIKRNDGMEEIPVMVGVGGERKWTVRRRERARRDGWGNEEPNKSEEE